VVARLIWVGAALVVVVVVVGGLVDVVVVLGLACKVGAAFRLKRCTDKLIRIQHVRVEKIRSRHNECHYRNKFWNNHYAKYEVISQSNREFHLDN
jgi:hypothetical protein